MRACMIHLRKSGESVILDYVQGVRTPVANYTKEESK